MFRLPDTARVKACGAPSKPRMRPILNEKSRIRMMVPVVSQAAIRLWRRQSKPSCAAGPAPSPISGGAEQRWLRPDPKELVPPQV